MRLRYATRRELIFTLLALPSVLGILLFFIVPFILSAVMAMIDNPVSGNFAGLSHFRATIENSAFQLAVQNTFSFLSMTVPLNMIFALFIALMLRRVGRLGKAFFGSFFLLPLVMPSGSFASFWLSLFGRTGFINGLFTHETINWLNTEYSLFLVVVIFLWKNVGFNIVIYLAGLNLIPKEYYENAAIDGAGRFQQFFSITFVYIMPATFMVFLLSIIQSFQAFREIFLLTGAYPHPSLYMLQHYLNNLFAALDYQRLSAAAHIMTLGIVALVLVMLWVQKRVMNYD
jgi:multiple sugar transport system permease protein